MKIFSSRRPEHASAIAVPDLPRATRCHGLAHARIADPIPTRVTLPCLGGGAHGTKHIGKGIVVGILDPQHIKDTFPGTHFIRGNQLAAFRTCWHRPSPFFCELSNFFYGSNNQHLTKGNPNKVSSKDFYEAPGGEAKLEADRGSDSDEMPHFFREKKSHLIKIMRNE